MVRVAFSFYGRARVSQGKNLRMRFSCFWVVAAAHYFVVLDEDAADLGVGSRGVGGDRLCQVQGFAHEVEVVRGGAVFEWRFSDRSYEAVSSDEE